MDGSQLQLIPPALDELLQPRSEGEPDEADRLIATVQRLSLTREIPGVMAIARRAARQLTGADGATFILREGDDCFYADEDAISPLWKGRRFPITGCTAGWAIINRQPVVIEDVYADPRIAHEIYRATFVRSLVVVPIRVAAPIGAIGCYWARPHLASTREIKLLQALADSASIAVENAQLYSELKKKIDESRRAVRARDEFLSVASHELRTPLTALKLQLQVLTELLRRQPGGGDPLLLERLSRATSSNERLAALVEALLDVSRVSLGRLALDLQSFDLLELAREVVERFADQAQQAGCPITLRPCAALVGRWDRGRIDQVLTNLLANAIKYGAGKPIELRLAARPTTAVLTVKDDGIGISSENLPLIFERFSRAASPRHYGGLGLGLYLSRQIVEAHGGTIRVQSRPGHGARFRVELPWVAPGGGAPRGENAR